MSYSQILGAADAATAAVAKPGAVVTTPSTGKPTVVTPAEHEGAIEYLKYSVAPALVAAFIGYKYGKKKGHKYLGAIGAAAIAGSVYPIKLGGQARKFGITMLASTGVGIMASKKFRKHPAIAYVVAAGAADFIAPHVGGSYKP